MFQGVSSFYLSDKADPLIRFWVSDPENRPKDVILKDGYIKPADRIVRQESRMCLCAVPCTVSVNSEFSFACGPVRVCADPGDIEVIFYLIKK